MKEYEYTIRKLTKGISTECRNITRNVWTWGRVCMCACFVTDSIHYWVEVCSILPASMIPCAIIAPNLATESSSLSLIILLYFSLILLLLLFIPSVCWTSIRAEAIRAPYGGRGGRGGEGAEGGRAGEREGRREGEQERERE